MLIMRFSNIIYNIYYQSLYFVCMFIVVTSRCPNPPAPIPNNQPPTIPQPSFTYRRIPQKRHKHIFVTDFWWRTHVYPTFVINNYNIYIYGICVWALFLKRMNNRQNGNISANLLFMIFVMLYIYFVVMFEVIYIWEYNAFGTKMMYIFNICQRYSNVKFLEVILRTWIMFGRRNILCNLSKMVFKFK